MEMLSGAQMAAAELAVIADQDGNAGVICVDASAAKPEETAAGIPSLPETTA